MSASIGLSDAVIDYLRAHNGREHPVLAKCRAEAERVRTTMQISPEQGAFMAFLLRMLNAKRVVEVGVYTGYSSIVMALALKDMHGAGAHTAGRLYSEALLASLDIPCCQDWRQVEQSLMQRNLAFMPLHCWMPELQKMIDLRNILGLRSPVHSLARILNPLRATCGLQSIFHPGYQAVHRDASALLGDRVIVIKGEGGEIEINPDSPCRLLGTGAEGNWEEDWPAQSVLRHVKPAQLQPDWLLAVWLGHAVDDYGAQAITGTIALALRGLGTPRETAIEKARQIWADRLGPSGAGSTFPG